MIYYLRVKSEVSASLDKLLIIQDPLDVGARDLSLLNQLGDVAAACSLVAGRLD